MISHQLPAHSFVWSLTAFFHGPCKKAAMRHVHHIAAGQTGCLLLQADKLFSTANQTASEAVSSIRTVAAFGMQVCDEPQGPHCSTHHT